MTEKRTHEPEVNQKIQETFRNKMDRLNLKRVEAYVLDEEIAVVKAIEKKSRAKAKKLYLKRFPLC